MEYAAFQWIETEVNGTDMKTAVRTGLDKLLKYAHFSNAAGETAMRLLDYITAPPTVPFHFYREPIDHDRKGQALDSFQPWLNFPEVSSAWLDSASRANAPNSSQSCQNSSINSVNRKNKYTSSPLREIQSKTKSKTNPKALFYSHFSKRLASMAKTSLPRGSNNCVEENPPDSSNIWTCDTCLMSNKVPAERCRSCDTLKYGIILQSYKWFQSNGKH
ncbi:uncharacterized protein [Heptranchias perlo]